MGQDLKGDHLEVIEDTHEDMEDLIIEPVAEADTEIGEGPLRRDMAHRDASVSPVRSASVFIVEDFEELTHMRIPIDVSEQIEQEQAGRVIAGRPIRGVTISHERSDKGEIDQGSNHLRVSALDRAVRENFDELFFKLVMGE
jgi:hypothetical protein